MESILARALEYTLKYWLKSFSRDQFKLQGRTVQLSNLDMNGDALHASLGLPPALNVATARVGKLEITLPSLNNVQIEPIVVQIDRLDLVLDENEELDASSSPSSTQSSTSPAKGSGYGFADKIADGMTVQIRTVNLLLETRGGARRQGGASWAPPMAAITMHNLSLYSTNENWQAVNLKEARDFSNNKKFIYVFKKLEWESLSIDLLPHPDMFADNIVDSEEGANKRDDDGAKRAFFGGERLLEGISGEANITIKRTELNSPLGLEVQLHITEAVSPALSEPGLRALLRFLTGLYVCLNRGDVDSKTQQRSTEAAGCSLVSIIVDHIFLCIKDAEFQLELLVQSLFFSRASVSDGANAKNLTNIMINGLFLRDIFSRPPCTLVQPSMQASTNDFLQIPDFAKDFCPPICPLGNQHWDLSESVPIICFHSLQVKPSPVPPSFASQTVIDCQPLMIHLQEESCLRIASFLADGIMVNHSDILLDNSINSLVFNLKELDVTIPLGSCTSDNSTIERCFTGARLHIENLFFLETPSVKLRLLNLEKDPACFTFWKGQPIDASQKKWTAGASHLSLCLETCSSSTEPNKSTNPTSGLWRCVELNGACVEVAMATADGNPLTDVPPPGGIVRVGVSCLQCFSNTSVEQLFFVLDLCSYFDKVSEKITHIGKSSRGKKKTRSFSGKLMERVPSDTAVSLAVEGLRLRFLESSSTDSQEMPLVQFLGDLLFAKVTYRTLGGAIAVSSTLRWDSVEVSCVDAEDNNAILVSESECPKLRSVFWVHKKKKHQLNGNALAIPFLDIHMDQMVPFDVQDKECHSLAVSVCISGVRLGGGMNYAEALLHRFGIFGPDGGPGEELSRGLENISSGPLSKLFKASPLTVDDLETDLVPGHEKGDIFLHLGIPDDVDASIELKDWLFALEGAQEMAERSYLYSHKDVGREQRCWHTTFLSLQVNAKSSPKHVQNGKGRSQRALQHPVELITVGVEGLQILKPQSHDVLSQAVSHVNGVKETFEGAGGIDLEARLVISDDHVGEEMDNWVVENLKFSVQHPIEAIVSKDELQHLMGLCKSEVESMGRIAAGVLRLLKLEKSVGQAAIDQLSNLGTEGFDKIFSAGKLDLTNGSSHENLVTLLEEEIGDSQAACAALISNVESSESHTHLGDIKQLSQKLQHMQKILTKLRTQI